MMSLSSYNAKWCELLYNELCIFHLYNSAGVSAEQQNLLVRLLLSRRTIIIMLCMLMLCCLFFTLIHEASSLLFTTAIMNSSTWRLVTSVQFSKAPSLLTLTSMHRCFSFFNVVRMKHIIFTGYLFMQY